MSRPRLGENGSSESFVLFVLCLHANWSIDVQGVVHKCLLQVQVKFNEKSVHYCMASVIIVDLVEFPPQMFFELVLSSLLADVVDELFWIRVVVAEFHKDVNK